MPAANLESVGSFFERVLNAGDLSSLEQFVHPGVIVPESAPGIEGIRRLLLDTRATFANPEYKVVETVAEGEKVAVRFAAKATHASKYMGIPASGLRLNFWGVMLLRFEAGAITEFRIVLDSQGILRQLREPALGTKTR